MVTDPVEQGVEADDGGTAGVFARPILLLPAAVLLGFVLDHLLPLPFAVPRFDPVHRVVPGVLILAAVALFAAGVREFGQAETPIPTNRPARALVTGGIYRWTRNPIYLSFLVLCAGIGVATRSPWIVTLALPLAVTIHYGVVVREEAYLERRFGDAYRDYKGRVRRWL